jgi:DnaJ-class molecular chaperone
MGNERLSLQKDVGIFNERTEINVNKTFDPGKYGMVLCPLCKGKGFVINPEREVCQNCGGFGYIKKES